MNRTFTLTVLHGETNLVAARAYKVAQQATKQAIANRVDDPSEFQVDNTDPLCAVQAIYEDGQGGRLEMNFSDWTEVAGLVTGATILVPIPAGG